MSKFFYTPGPYPEIESRGFSDKKEGKSNPYPQNTDHHKAWEYGASFA